MKKAHSVCIFFLFLVGLSACGDTTTPPSGLDSAHSAALPTEPYADGVAEEQTETAVEAEPSDAGTAGGSAPELSREASPPEEHGSLMANRYTSWQAAYAHYLNEGNFDEFYVGDINGDGIPELVIRYYDVTNQGEILWFDGHGLSILQLFVVSDWGRVGYVVETNQIICLQWYGHTTGTFGSVDFYLYEWTPDGYAETTSVIRESGYDSRNDGNGVYGQGYIGGEPVDFDEFEVALSEMYALLEQSTWFPMTDADDVDDYFQYMMQWKPAINH